MLRLLCRSSSNTLNSDMFAQVLEKKNERDMRDELLEQLGALGA